MRLRIGGEDPRKGCRGGRAGAQDHRWGPGIWGLAGHPRGEGGPVALDVQELSSALGAALQRRQDLVQGGRVADPLQWAELFPEADTGRELPARTATAPCPRGRRGGPRDAPG